jgi:hypothetical protein
MDALVKLECFQGLPHMITAELALRATVEVGLLAGLFHLRAAAAGGLTCPAVTELLGE